MTINFKTMNKVKKIFYIFIALILFISSCLSVFNFLAMKNQRQVTTSRSFNENKEIQKEDYNSIIRKVSESVVSIRVTKIEDIKNPITNNLFSQNSLFNQDNFDLEELLPPIMQPKKKRISVYGSGFVISEDGLIITNYHVVENAKKIKISFLNDEDYFAEIIGIDPMTDIALLKIEGKKKFNFLEFTKSENIKVGDKVLAVGNPFELQGTVTAGIISSLGRSINTSLDVDFIQTDAAINSGNSGGPMIDINGSVIGINTAIVTPSGGNVGIGFAIPSDKAISIIEQIKNGKEINRGRLGVIIQPITEDFAEALSMKNDMGALVVDIDINSNAAKKGIKKGDVILSVNNIKIKNFSQLPSIISTFKPNEIVKLEITRYGEKKNFEIELMKRESFIKKEKKEKISDNKIEYFQEIGIKDLSDNMKKFFRIDKDAQGVIIFDIKNIRTLEQDQLQIGDIITQINETIIKNKVDFKKVINSLANKTAVFYVTRDGMNSLMAVSIKE